MYGALLLLLFLVIGQVICLTALGYLAPTLQPYLKEQVLIHVYIAISLYVDKFKFASLH